MRVVDAGVVIELIAGDLDPAVLGEEELSVPHLLDSEVTSVLRRLVLGGRLTERQGQQAGRRTWCTLPDHRGLTPRRRS